MLTLAIGTAVLSAIAISGYYLFFRNQIRLAELLAITACLGSVLGLGLKYLVPEKIPEDDLPWYLSLSLLAILWILGGAGWAQRIMSDRNVDDTGKRLLILFFFWVLLGIPVLLFLNAIVVLPSESGFVYFLCSTIFVIFLFFLDSLVARKVKRTEN